ncbi:flagellar filament capping protein FliD [Bacillus toyonensis]|uniref:flagellar filament capping protein FliD n=1 Tax=Bacillus toyonensis TaxID=155322 RepID=UPI002E1D4E5F|nr:flagellar filament capping protein FliD [Bacillus toyonensis]MED2737531.1 flagellar filament capping protein FliD [Bacillus toyonensis]
MASIFDKGQITQMDDRLQIFGLGSQWDTKAIIEAELKIMQLRQKPYIDKQKTLDTEKQVWNSFKSSLTSFNNIVKQVKDMNSDSKAVKMSEEGFVNITAKGDALDAAYSISVEQVATKHRLMGDKQPEGPLGIEETVQLNGKDLKITADMDVKAIAKTINDGGFKTDAVVIDNKLVLTAKETGKPNELKFSNSAAWETLGITSQGLVKNQLQEAVGAKFTINGIKMESDTNTYSEIDGITIDFTKETKGTIDFTVERSVDDVVKKVKDLVDGYNKVLKDINSVSGEKGFFQSEQLPKMLKKQMNDLLFTVKESGTMLYELGINLDKDAKNGTITFDEDKFKKMYAESPKKTTELIAGKEGFGGKLYDIVDRYTKAKGMIQSEIDGLDTRIKRISATIDKFEVNFKKQQKAIVKKYAIFETMMAGLNQQNQYLMAQLGMSNNDK